MSVDTTETPEEQSDVLTVERLITAYEQVAGIICAPLIDETMSENLLKLGITEEQQQYMTQLKKLTREEQFGVLKTFYPQHIDRRPHDLYEALNLIIDQHSG